MKRTILQIICVALCVIMISTVFTSCSKNVEITEANVTDAVVTVDKALKEFDCKTLRKYVESETLDTILTLAENHEQFGKLGQKIFENLEMTVTDIDITAKTVTLSVVNKNLYAVASTFAYNLKSEHSTFEMLELLKNEAFLDISLSDLTSEMDEITMKTEPVSITLNIKQGKKNLVLCFDEAAEDAVSGGAITAIQKVFDIKAITKK